MNLGRQAFGHLVRQVHNRIVFEGTGFFVLGKQVAVFAVGIEKGLAGSVVLVLVKDFTTVEAVGIGKHLVVKHLVTREVQATHVVLAAFDHVDMDQNGAGGLDIVVLVEDREHVFDHVADHQLFLVGRTLLDLAEFIDFRVVPLAAIHDFQEFLTGIFVADNVVQHFPGVFFGLDRDLRSRYPRHFAHFTVVTEEVGHLHGRLARHLVKRRCRVTQSKVQLLVKDFQVFAQRNHAAHIEQAGGVRQVFGTVFGQFRIQIAKMANGIQHRVAISLKNVFLEFATAPPLVQLCDHVFHNVFGRHMVVTLDIKLADFDLFAFTDKEGHHILVFVHRRFAVAHFGQQVAFGAVEVQNSLAVAFQLALAVNLPRNHTELELQIFFGFFVAAFEYGRIQSREFLNLENEVDIGAITHVINPGGHIVKEARLVKRRHRGLYLFSQGRRRIALTIANTDTAKDRAIVHVDGSFDLYLMDLIFDHIALGHFGHVQKLGLSKPYKHSKKKQPAKAQNKPTYKQNSGQKYKSYKRETCANLSKK